MKLRKSLTLAFLVLMLGSRAQQSGQDSEQGTTFNEEKRKAWEVAAQKGWARRQVLPNGRVIELIRLSANGFPVYYGTHNAEAAATTSTNKVYPGGGLGLSLTGSALPLTALGEWDGGAVRGTHQELTGRVTQVDGATSQIDHATHVAGTLIGSGVQANAKGMAYQAKLRAYDWTSDQTEMTAAAQNGMLVSNHSYGNLAGFQYGSFGPATGWYWFGDPSISATEDYSYGYYDQEAADWDGIAYSYPNYLPVKAAGNDRGDTPGSGAQHYVWDGTAGNWVSSNAVRQANGGALGYDCIGSAAVAKNVLTIGAVNSIPGGYTNSSQVVMSSFSGWGPTDDGRIKPDICGNGVGIYSSISTSNSAYASFDGTSMASPNVTGSLALLQQHYRALNNMVSMRAATLKGLVIHTADEAGANPGPDYAFGWGLLNTAKAATMITQNNTQQFIKEENLTQGQTYTFQVNSNGTTPLRATICWTDPAASVSAAALNNPAIKLVNDLDLRIIQNSNNTITSPWVLNPISRTAAATRGDNIFDNVEQVLLNAPVAGTYTIRVTHKNTLTTGSQKFSLLVTGGTIASTTPSASFTASTTNVCTGSSVQFTNTSTGTFTSSVWTFAGGTPSTFSGNNPPAITYNTPGSYSVKLKVSGANGSDSVTLASYIQVGGKTVPFIEDFETGSFATNGWTVLNPDTSITWRADSPAVVGANGGTKAAMIRFYSYANPTGQRDGLISPSFSFTGISNPSLSFKHAYTRYPNNPTDSLVVYASSGCSNNWVRLAAFGEGGTGTFATSGAGFQNTAEFVPSSSTNWCGQPGFATCKTISLASFTGQTGVRIKFESVNAYGNNLYLDDIAVSGAIALSPVAKFGATGSTTVCAGSAISFVDSSLNTPTSWSWSFPGGTPSNSSSQNPTITYSTPGVYSVTLTVTNSTGSNSLTKTGFVQVGGGSLPFTEDFENGFGAKGWTVVNPDNLITWNLATVTAPATSGTKAAFMSFYTYTPGTGQTDELISPPMNITGMSNPQLSFKHAYTRYTNIASDTLVVYASSGCSTNWVKLATYAENGSGSFATTGTSFQVNTSFNPTLSSQWCGSTGFSSCKTVNLSQFANQSGVRLRFVSINKYSNNLYLDDINVSATVIPQPPVAKFGVTGSTTLCANTMVSFRDSSTGIPTSWSWSFPGGNPSNSSLQNPSVAYSTAGTYAVILTVSNAQGSNTLTKTAYITVKAKPTVTFGTIPALCANDSSIQLTSGSPSGGIYFGSGVSNGRFYPSLSGVGTFTLLYNVTAANGCSDSALQTVQVKSVPTVTFGPLQAVCSNNQAIALTTGTPSGGTYTGPGVSGSVFTPSFALIGFDTLRYTVTSNGCSASATRVIEVKAAPSVTFSNPSPVCQSSTPVVLTGGSPAGGTYSGTGVSNGQFNPSGLAVGSYTITYQYTGANGCSATSSGSISVLSGPSVTFGAITPICQNANPLSLTTGQPAGGTYSGQGVSNGVFTPTTPGSYVLTYSVTASGCTATDTETIVVKAVPPASFAALPSFCTNSPNYTLPTPSPAGGVYTGNGVSGNLFSPAQAGAGTFVITYTASVNGCLTSATQNVTVTALPQITFSSFSGVCVNDPPILLNQASPTGGVYTGTGIQNGTFVPSLAGAGSFTISYVLASNGCINSASQSITVSPKPTQPQINLVGFNQLMSSASYGNRWFLGGMPTGDTTVLITPTQNGNYSVMAVQQMCSSDTSAPYTFSTVGVNSATPSVLRLYPNPAVNQLTAELPEGGLWQVEILDVQGRTLRMYENLVGSRVDLTLQGLTDGLYVLRISQKERFYTARFIKRN